MALSHIVPRRVVVTGLGAVSPIGNSKDDFWIGLSTGRNGISIANRIDPENYSSKISGEVKDFDPSRYLDRREIKRMGLF